MTLFLVLMLILLLCVVISAKDQGKHLYYNIETGTRIKVTFAGKVTWIKFNRGVSCGEALTVLRREVSEDIKWIRHRNGKPIPQRHDKLFEILHPSCLELVAEGGLLGGLGDETEDCIIQQFLEFMQNLLGGDKNWYMFHSNIHQERINGVRALYGADLQTWRRIFDPLMIKPQMYHAKSKLSEIARSKGMDLGKEDVTKNRKQRDNNKEKERQHIEAKQEEEVDVNEGAGVAVSANVRAEANGDEINSFRWRKKLPLRDDTPEHEDNIEIDDLNRYRNLEEPLQDSHHEDGITPATCWWVSIVAGSVYSHRYLNATCWFVLQRRMGKGFGSIIYPKKERAEETTDSSSKILESVFSDECLNARCTYCAKGLASGHWSCRITGCKQTKTGSVTSFMTHIFKVRVLCRVFPFKLKWLLIDSVTKTLCRRGKSVKNSLAY